jgi:Asp/Glu/hydantoin racemase
MAKQLALVHTVPGLISTFAPLVKKHLPGWTVFNIADESLLQNSIREGSLSRLTMRRLAGYVNSAAEAGADAILVTCSSVGPAVDAARPFCPVPLMRVDEGMADKASDLGARIGVLATLQTTLEPTRELIARMAATKGKSPEIVARVCDGAFQVLSAGDRDGHDRLVAAELVSLAARVDVVVLAQASMARVLEGERAVEVGVPVLSSPELGVLRLKSYLGE